jgi:hypothetical protein
MKYEKEKSAQVAVSPKKTYRTPKLTIFGTLARITTAEFGKAPGTNDCFSQGHIFKHCGSGDFFHAFS